MTDKRWAQNLVGYYRDRQKWSLGPHLFVTPGGILAFTPLTESRYPQGPLMVRCRP
jgi:hypothetical protein